MTAASFAMICCQNGAQAAVLKEIEKDGWRLAFSRPGFVTVKSESTSDRLPRGVFVRTASWSLGKANGSDSAAILAQVDDAINENRERLSRGRDGRHIEPAADIAEKAGPAKLFDQFHLWPRDRVPVGKFDFEPGGDEVSKAIADLAFDRLRPWLSCEKPNQVAKSGQRVLDIVLVDPSHWWVGFHDVPASTGRRANGRAGLGHLAPLAWPGGVQPIVPTVPVISRAYFKAAEAIEWSGFPIKAGDHAMEVGSSPGGACGRLLELGLSVLGIDPGDMADEIMEHPKFRHIRARAGDVPRREFHGVKWLLVDSNVRPDQSLTTVEHIVTHRQSTIEGMLLTMKLGGFEHADRIPGWIARLLSWGASDVRVRNLARGKVEVCIAARMKRR